jgi:uncharacterized membrane protein YgaE (UPF0421/DUF939 family)
MLLLGEASFLSDVTAILVAIGGLVAAVVSLLRYLDERRKRKAAEHKLDEVLTQVKQLCEGADNSGKETESQARQQFHDQLEEIKQQLNEAMQHPR